MSHARRAARECEHDRENEDNRHPALTPLVIDVIGEQTRTEIEASIDEPLAVERGPPEWENENADLASEIPADGCERPENRGTV